MDKGREKTTDRSSGGQTAGAPRPTRPFLRPSLGPDTSVTGRLSFEAPTRIDGTLRGEVRAEDLLVIGETGLVEGVVRAGRLIVHGRIHGEIRDTQYVEIVRGAVVSGVLEAQILLVHEGATVDSDVKVTPPRSASVQVSRPSTSS